MKTTRPLRQTALRQQSNRTSELSYQESVCKRIAKIKEVDASFIVPDESGTVHVYSVVEEYGDFYDRLIRQERLIEKDCPGISFDFHVRARQSREPFQVAPIDAHPVFVR